MTHSSEQMIPTWVNGKLQPVEKLWAHQKGLKHKAVSVFLMKDDELLIQRRALSKYHTPGLWANTCCTHPLWGELDIDCARRRMKEELGIDGLNYIHSGEIEYRADVGQGLIEHEVAQIFVAKVDKTPNIALNPDEVMEIQWKSLIDLKNDISNTPGKYTPWIKTYLFDHTVHGLIG